jgi:glycosyltransferase involved in cell wall biosynthesis
LMSQTPQHVPVLSVVIPVYNESETWGQVLARVEGVDLPGVAKQIIFVDDFSTDGTREQLERFSRNHHDLPGSPRAGEVGCTVLFHDRNRGKGAALRTGFAAATGEVVLVQDADLEYHPSDYPRLVGPILQGRADVVYGSRFRTGRPRQAYLRNYLANRFLTLLSNIATGYSLTDMETCYKVLKREVLRGIHLEQDRFGFEPEITAKLAAMGARIHETPIRYEGRTHAQGKKIGFRDGLEAIWCILKYAVVSRRTAPSCASLHR